MGNRKCGGHFSFDRRNLIHLNCITRQQHNLLGEDREYSVTLPGQYGWCYTAGNGQPVFGCSYRHIRNDNYLQWRVDYLNSYRRYAGNRR